MKFPVYEIFFEIFAKKSEEIKIAGKLTKDEQIFIRNGTNDLVDSSKKWTNILNEICGKE